ncbi:MAG: response regulator transcription factor [Bacteroidetes bacterium]|nr:response regulator transcription factor [Bacteroidota bacterium]
MKLMIVDDSAEMRKSIRSIVTNTRDTVFECENGSQVLPIYVKEHPDYVLMDINMPVMNGIEATRNLIAKFPEARVLIISNYNDDEFRKEAEESGAIKYFVKDNLIDIKTYLLKDWVIN